MPVWPGREGTENATNSAAAAAEWRKNETEGDREQEGRDEGLYGGCKRPAGQVCPTESAEHATGLPVRKSLVESQPKFRRDAACIQRLCPGRRPNDALLRHGKQKDQLGKREHLPG